MVLTVACLQSKRHSSPQNMWNQHSVFFISCFCCPLSWISTKLKRRHRGDGCLIVKKHSHSIQFCHNCFEHFSPFLNCSCPFFVAALCTTFPLSVSLLLFNPSVTSPPLLPPLCAPDLLSLCVTIKSTGSSKRSCHRCSPSDRPPLRRGQRYNLAWRSLSMWVCLSLS